MQYKAGYFFNSIFDLFLNKTVKEKVEKIVFQLSHFNLETSDELKHQQVDSCSEIKLIHNLIERGVPTIPSTFIEDLFATIFGLTKRDISELNNISHNFVSDSLSDDIYRAIHIIDPRINKTNQFIDIQAKTKLQGKGFKLDFHYSLVPEYLGQAYIQLIEEDRDFRSLLNSAGLDNEIQQNFQSILDEKNDFVIEMPYEFNSSKGITIEIDEAPSETKYKFEIDKQKKELCKTISWSEPFVIDKQKFTENSGALKPLMDFTYNEYFDTIGKNYRNPVYNTSSGLNALQFALTPLAIGRLHKTIIEYLLSGNLKLNDENWKIGVIERDVPCAHLAFQDLKLHFENLFTLEGSNKKFPQVSLKIFKTTEFKNAKLNDIYIGEVYPIENFDENEDFDLLIDISVIQRFGVINTAYQTKAKFHAKIKSVKSINAERKILTDKLISYQDFTSVNQNAKDNDKAKTALKYFLRNIFRKDDFLPGQLELVNNILQQKNSLGLLPAAGGKSIVYQLATFLQPGISIIVNPIVSVSSNQIDALKKLGIDCISSIDSSLKNAEKLAINFQKLENSETLFCYISPEYLRQKDLRDTFNKMQQNEASISFFVVDEAHCISEWSHDFRTTYHKLGELRDLIIKNKNKQKITTIALSATASNACQFDISEELLIEKENIVEVIGQYSNLNFRIIDATSNQLRPEMTIAQIKKLVGTRKQVHFSFLVKELFADQKDKSKEINALIYTATTYGITGISDNLGDGISEKLASNFERLKIGAYWGTTNDAEGNVLIKDIVQSEINHTKFIDNELDILVATPSLGVGTYKSDIRNVIFYSQPTSIENFIQQTLRAGADGKESTCTILIDRQEFSIPENSSLSGFIDTSTSTFDKYLAYEKIHFKYKGKDKELVVIDGLFKGTTSEKTTHIDIIRDLIKYGFDIETELTFQPKSKPARVYVNSVGKTYGYVDLSNFQFNIDESNFENESSRKLVHYVAQEIKNRCKKTENAYKTLSTALYQAETEGIDNILNRIKSGGIQELFIPFANDGLSKIAESLQKELSASFTINKIKDFYYSSLSVYDFVDKINSVKTIDKKNELINTISDLYRQTRTKAETLIAVYRLSKLDFIEDYIVDELNQQIIAKIKKKASEAYLIKLQEIIENFLLPEKASEIKEQINKISDNYIKNTIQGYVNFIYDYIVKERFKSIETLNQILLQITDNKDTKKDFNKEIRELFSNYFDAKYTSSFFGLIPGSGNISEESNEFTIIENYQTTLGSLKENWFHLKKSTDRLTKILPDDPIPYLLDAYTNLVSGEKDEKIIDADFDEIARGFIKMRKLDSYKPENYQTNIKSFLNQLFQHRPDLKESYESILWLRIHYIWLKDLNKKII